MVEDRIGLADFLTDLRAELSEAQSRATGDALKLGVEEISLTLEVAYTLTTAAEASAGAKAKFWVFAEAEAGAKGTRSAERGRTQQLTLTLKPRVEHVVINQQGQQTTVTRGVDVEGSCCSSRRTWRWSRVTRASAGGSSTGCWSRPKSRRRRASTPRVRSPLLTRG